MQSYQRITLLGHGSHNGGFVAALRSRRCVIRDPDQLDRGGGLDATRRAGLEETPKLLTGSQVIGFFNTPVRAAPAQEYFVIIANDIHRVTLLVHIVRPGTCAARFA